MAQAPGVPVHQVVLREGGVGADTSSDRTLADTVGLRVEFLTGGKGMGALNVKGIGEIPNVPTAAAIANAVADAVGVRIDTLPITAKKVLWALTAASASTTT